jgi:hypothetical protein
MEERMFTKFSHTKTGKPARQRVNWREVGAWVGDAIGAISIFATGYILLLIGHGLGLN